MRIALLHSHERRQFRETIDSGDYRLVCYGHTHVAAIDRHGETLVVNPGAIYRAEPAQRGDCRFAGRRGDDRRTCRDGQSSPADRAFGRTRLRPDSHRYPARRSIRFIGRIISASSGWQQNCIRYASSGESS